MTAKTVEVNGGQLYYEVKGQGRPLVLIHAGFLDSRMWDEQFESYSKDHLVVRYDVRGFGKSSIPENKYSDVEDLNVLIRHLRLDKPILVGCSNGGSIAIDYALVHAGEVKGLILIGSGVSGRKPQNQEEEKVWEELENVMAPQNQLAKEGRFKESVEIDLDAWASAQTSKSREKIASIALDNAPAQAKEWWKHRIRPTPPSYERLAEIKVPTLVMIGDRDQAGMKVIADDLHGKIKGSKKTIINGADHIVNMSRPKEFDRAVLDFLAFMQP